MFRLSLGTAKRLICTVSSHHLALTNIQRFVGISAPIYLPPDQWPFCLSFILDEDTRKKVRGKEVGWEAFWCRFSELTDRSLIVEIQDYGVSVPEEKLLAPLRDFKAESFEVFLPWWGESNRAGTFEGLNFMVRRPPEGMDLTMHMDVAKYNTGIPAGTSFWQRLEKG